MNRRMFLKIAGAVAFGLLHPVQAVRAALRQPEQKAGVVFPEDGILRSIIVGPWKTGGHATVTLSDSKHDPGAITLFNIVAIPHDELWAASCFCYIRVHSGQRLNVTDGHGTPMPFTAWCCFESGLAMGRFTVGDHNPWWSGRFRSLPS